MLRRFLEILRIIVISPEVVALLSFMLVYWYWPHPYELIGSKFSSNTKLWEYIPAIPLSILSFAVYLTFQLQAPIPEANRELYDWEMYWALKYRIIASLFWAGISAILSLSIWFFNSELSHALVGCFFLSAVGLSIIVVSTEILALFSLKEILAKEK
jgi:hypothetical protein